MKLALTEIFLDDLLGLPLGIQHKCQEMLSTLRQTHPKNLQDQVLPGWRLHKLKSSPFTTLSIDLNYRILAKFDGETVLLYRVVKHSLADSPNINRNDRIETPLTVNNYEIKPSDIYSVLISIGFSSNNIQLFKDIETEDELVDRLSKVDNVTADYILAVYETSALEIPRTKYILFQTDKEILSAIKNKQLDWDIYLHPSQKYLVELPVNARYAVSGSAGTGKTVCAWYRLKHLAMQKHRIGFVVPNNAALKVSQEKIVKMLEGSPIDCYYLVPTDYTHIIQLAQVVDHVIIDEGQEFSPIWYEKLGQALTNSQTGLTLFYDMNQLGGMYQTGDNKRYEHRLSCWPHAIESIPNIFLLTFYINYRNSREIAEYYFEQLNIVLPNPIRSEIPIFSCGDVLSFQVHNEYQAYLRIVEIIKKIKKEYLDNEIGIITVGSAPRVTDLRGNLSKFNISVSPDLTINNRILVSAPRAIRGYEKKAIIVVCSKHSAVMDIGKAIEFYISFSRARDRLFVIEILGK